MNYTHIHPTKNFRFTDSNNIPPDWYDYDNINGESIYFCDECGQHYKLFCKLIINTVHDFDTSKFFYQFEIKPRFGLDKMFKNISHKCNIK